MKISTALDIMLDKEENSKTFTGGRDKFEKEFEEGVELINDWQQLEQLGEVGFDYYDETGKTLSLSIGFRSYWVTMNDFIRDRFLYSAFDSKEEYLEEEVDFENISIMYEDEGDTWYEDIFLKTDSDNKEVLSYLKTAIQDFFKENE